MATLEQMKVDKNVMKLTEDQKVCFSILIELHDLIILSSSFEASQVCFSFEFC